MTRWWCPGGIGLALKRENRNLDLQIRKNVAMLLALVYERGAVHSSGFVVVVVVATGECQDGQNDTWPSGAAPRDLWPSSAHNRTQIPANYECCKQESTVSQSH